MGKVKELGLPPEEEEILPPDYQKFLDEDVEYQKWLDEVDDDFRHTKLNTSTTKGP